MRQEAIPLGLTGTKASVRLAHFATQRHVGESSWAEVPDEKAASRRLPRIQIAEVLRGRLVARRDDL
jgi:hypothetical protein